MEITIIICITVTFCVSIYLYYKDKQDERKKLNDDLLNSMSNDIDVISNVINRIDNYAVCTNAAIQNIKTIKYILSKYSENNEVINSKTEKS